MDVDEDQASGEPLPETMDQTFDGSTSSVEQSKEGANSQPERNKQMIMKKKIEQYFQLVTQGCNRPNCENPNCASNPKNDRIFGNEAAVKALELLRQKAEICPLNTNDSTIATSSTSNHSVTGSAPVSSVKANDISKTVPKDNVEQIPTIANSNRVAEKYVTKEKKKDLKVYRVEGVKYLTEEMVDELILKCKEEEESLPDADGTPDDDPFMKAARKDPYNSLFVALTEVFSNMDNLNRSFLRKTESNPVSVESDERMEVDIAEKNVATDSKDDIPMTDVTDSAVSAGHSMSVASALSSFFSNELPNTSDLRRSNALKKQTSSSKAQSVRRKVKVSAPTVDVEAVRRVYKKLHRVERANDAFVSSLYLLSANVDVHLNIMKQLPGALNLNLFVIVIENPMLHSPEYFETALPEFCKAMGKLPEEATVELVKYWSMYSQDRLKTIVECFQQLLTVKVVEARLSQSDDAETMDLHKNVAVANAVRCLKVFYYASLYGGKIDRETSGYVSKSSANSFDFPADEFDIEKKSWKDPLSDALGVSECDVIAPILPMEEFQNEVLNESISVYNDFTNAIDYELRNDEFTFMKYPFVLNIVNKTTFFFYDNKVQMLSGRRLMILQSILSHSPVSPYLRLKINRDRVIGDALVQLEMIASESPIDLRKQLYVEFEGEQGVDEGGVSKEFFQLVVEQIFNPDYGMFTYDEDTHLFWFNPHSFENSAQFTLIGIVLGLAIYNSCILDIKFPAVVFKKLLGKKATFEDLQQSHPSIYQSLHSLINYDGNVEEDFMAVFSVEYHDMFDENRKHDLKPDGGNIPVTNENKKEFVELYTTWLLNDSIKSQFEAFRHGFDLVVAKSPLKYLFRSDELEVLISGSQEYDFKSLEDGTEYDGGFTTESATIKHFWKVVHEMSEEDKRKLLQFTTGTDRAPVGGLAQLKLVIARNGPASDRLPTAHTCFNVILLPDYQDFEKLKERLYKAITYAKGFGML